MEPTQKTSSVDALRSLSEEVFKSTIAQKNNWILASTGVEQLLRKHGILPPIKTPLQEFAERVWADDNESDS